jgi:membrane fusion protein, heavy metal efflux system
MSIALPKPGRPSLPGFVSWVVLGLGIMLLVVNLAWMVLGASRSTATADELTPAAPAFAPASGSGPGGLPDKVTLSEGKLKSAGIDVENVQIVTLPTELGVPGKIDANQDREVMVRPRASGVIREVKAVLGQKLKKGDLLAVLDSADVGSARLNLRAKQRELATVRFEADWKRQVAANVAELVPLLDRRVEASDIAKKFIGRPLGTFRAALLEAYSQFDIAAHEEEKTIGLRRDRIVGEHPESVAVHTREGKQAVFQGTVEQSQFEAQQQSRVAAQAVRMAEAAVVDAAHRLRILGVSQDVARVLADANDGTVGKRADEDVTRYDVVAPFDGTVIARMAVVSQKAEVNDMLFTVADLSTVWVTANIPESDFALLPALNRGKIRVSAAAYPGRSFDANLLSIGATVDATTRTVPMLAETQNSDALLKIGMFVRILLDTAVATRGMTVPAAAVVDVEGVKGVFLPDPTEPRTFRFRPIKIDRAAGDRLVVASGLKEGEAVVAKGAFLLKSELILQNESGED